MNIMNSHVVQHYDPGLAETVAAEMTDLDDEGWTYTVNHDPKGTGDSFIEIFDEEGEFVGRW